LDNRINKLIETSEGKTSEATSEIKQATTKTAVSTVIFCGLIELLIVCAIGFRFYFLSNVYRETSEAQRAAMDHTTTANTSFTVTPQPPPSQPSQQSGRKIGFYSEPQTSEPSEPSHTPPPPTQQPAPQPQPSHQPAPQPPPQIISKEPQFLIKVCEVCGSDFYKKTTWQRFCSTKCRNTYNDKNKK
jgi:hypothetical protein